MTEEATLPALDQLDARLVAAETLIEVLLERTAITAPSFKEGLEAVLKRQGDEAKDISSPFQRQVREGLSRMLKNALTNVGKVSDQQES